MKCSVNWYNPFMSIMINFYHLPFKQACRLPIACYGKPRFISMHGAICIDSDDIRFRMIKLNVTKRNPYHSTGPFEYVNDGGTLRFLGPVTMSTGCRIIMYYGGVVSIGKHSVMNNTNIGCSKSITIGQNVRIAGGATIYDTNFHFIYNKKKHSVKDISGRIVIGDYVWVGTNVYIAKGTTMPKGCIIAANSIVSRPIENINEYSIIAGHPAKVVAEGYVRILGSLEEHLYKQFATEKNKRFL